MPRRFLIAIAVILGGCGVQISEKTNPSPRFPEAQYTATTFWYSNNKAEPRRKMLRAAARTCHLSKDAAETPLLWQEPYGLAGTWWLDFACPAPETD